MFYTLFYCKTHKTCAAISGITISNYQSGNFHLHVTTNRSGTTPRHMVLWSMLFTTFNNNDRRGNIVSWELSIKFAFGTAKILFTGAAVVLGKEIQRLSYEPQLHLS